MPSKFRSSFTQVEGHEPAKVVQGRVVNINLVKWTVDVVAQYDRMRYFNIQVSTPYLHHSNGEGIYIFPEIGATCMVCIPSDSSAPFVLAFVMAPETINDSSTDAPAGTSSHGSPQVNATDSSFAGGRPQPKPGDIWMRTRDENFVILHRGGVLQIGATELAQRIFIPLRNLVTDISENYEHHNSNGSVVWGIQDGPSQKQIPSQFVQTFRVFSTDQYADVKLAWGKVFSPVPEPDNGVLLAEAGVGQGDDGQGSNPIIFEVTVSPKGFIAQNGDMASAGTPAASVLKFTFDRTGNALARFEGNFFLKVSKKLTFKVTEAIDIESKDAVTMKSANGFDITDSSYVHLQAPLVRLGAGGNPVARMGDPIALALVAVPMVVTFASPPVQGPNPAVVAMPPTQAGFITGGNPAVLA